MKLKLTDYEKERVTNKIEEVLKNGTEWRDENAHFPAGAIIDAVESIDGMTKDDSDEDSSEGFTCNGWQWDWWQAFTHNGKKYILSGSGHYGGHSFGLAD